MSAADLAKIGLGASTEEILSAMLPTGSFKAKFNSRNGGISMTK
jgi:hypothetical protein